MASTAATATERGGADLGLTPADLRRMYAEMTLARLLDERMLQLNKIGKAPFVISCQGQEGAQIGAAFALEKGKDWFLPYYRDLALCLHLGMTARDVMLSLFARPDDIIRRQGRCHRRHATARGSDPWWCSSSCGRS